MTDRKFRADAATRLRRFRNQAGYPCAADFARAHNLNVTTYAHHERGRRAITWEAGQRYAALLNTTAAYLVFGEATAEQRRLPIVGVVADGGRVLLFKDMDSATRARYRMS